MVRSASAFTFSSSPYFDDRAGHGIAQPITERVNVGASWLYLSVVADLCFKKPHSRPIVSYYFPKGVGEHHYGVNHFFVKLLSAVADSVCRKDTL